MVKCCRVKVQWGCFTVVYVCTHVHACVCVWLWLCVDPAVTLSASWCRLLVSNGAVGQGMWCACVGAYKVATAQWRPHDQVSCVFLYRGDAAVSGM